MSMCAVPIVCTEHDLEDVMDMEVFVDLHRLRDLARLGVPSALRGRVYKYLLGVTTADKSHEVTQQRRREQRFLELVPAEDDTLASRFGQMELSKLRIDEQTKLGAVLRALYLTWDIGAAASRREPNHVLQENALVTMALIFGTVLDESCDVYDCVCAFYTLNLYRDFEGLRDACGTFNMLLRETLPDLHHFLLVVADVAHERWLPEWMSGLLANNLHPGDVLSLWDVYVSESSPTQPLALHMYVCLALLDLFREQIIVMPSANDVVMFLRRLPRIPVDTVVTHARNKKEEVQCKKIL
eukprot:PhM_4_TR8549/c0_g1_i1/m.90593/K20360/TBC1D22, GYP1; TBC1 domain family member 2